MTAESNRAIAREIKASRARARLDQATVARAAGIPLVSYRRYESGERDINVATLDCIAAALGVTVRELWLDAERHSPGAFAVERIKPREVGPPEA